METVADLSDNRQNSKKRPASAITIEAEIHDLPSDSQLIERQATKKQKISQTSVAGRHRSTYSAANLRLSAIATTVYFAASRAVQATA